MAIEEDHPRVCGEKSVCIIELWQQAGSPPRVRGKENKDRCDFCRTRITPACAGKRSPLWPALLYWQDHPRVCGEKCLSRVPGLQVIGSPPRVRGKVLESYQTDFEKRITPACAGKSRGSLRRCRQRRDHPRVCGEKVIQRQSLRTGESCG